MTGPFRGIYSDLSQIHRIIWVKYMYIIAGDWRGDLLGEHLVFKKRLKRSSFQ